MKRAVAAVLLCVCLPSQLMAQPLETIAVGSVSLAQEPFYSGIVADATRLRAETKNFAARPSLEWLKSPHFSIYAEAITELAARDMKGHDDLKARGTDNDLKCILKGVSIDLRLKLEDLRSARTDHDLGRVLEDMTLLLDDNIDVVTTPATAVSGLDCVIEFGPDA
jgi:hypothetical protein